MPPIGLRRLVGPIEDKFFDNPTGDPVFPEFPPEAYSFVLDFGCGCGRIARQLLQQREPPGKYVGVDLHRGMIRWCRKNLQPLSQGFEFHHQDIRNPGLNPMGSDTLLPFPVQDNAVTLLLAWSVFTHVDEAAAEFYLREVARVLAPEGVALTTWFLFDKTDYPMMQEFQNALFINPVDPTNAVIFDKVWLASMAARVGLAPVRLIPPDIRGFQWRIVFRRQSAGVEPVGFPEDLAPKGIERPPLTPARAETLGVADATDDPQHD
ncbi:MAG TPA: class I SAM-dependent methyltransferase [Rhodanobacteraceae bacterium]|nr:class I SAM-dependent methyltransferase [Rhodanobacteraceae bacterium]